MTNTQKNNLKVIIYIPLWLDLLLNRQLIKPELQKYLHSTMVRFIIAQNTEVIKSKRKFTFHYG